MKNCVKAHISVHMMGKWFALLCNNVMLICSDVYLCSHFKPGMTFWDISVMYNELSFFFYWHFEFTLWQCWIEYQSWIKFQRWGTSIVSKACLQPYWSNFTTHLKIPLLFSWGLEGFARHPFLHFQGCQYLYYSSFPHVPSLPLYLSLPPSLPHLLPLVHVLWIPMVIIVNQGKQKILRWIFVSHKISYGGSNTKELLLSG